MQFCDHCTASTLPGTYQTALHRHMPQPARYLVSLSSVVYFVLGGCAPDGGSSTMSKPWREISDPRFESYLSRFVGIESVRVRELPLTQTGGVPPNLVATHGHTHHTSPGEFEVSAIPLESGHIMMVFMCLECHREMSGAEEIGIVLRAEGNLWKPQAVMMARHDCVNGPRSATNLSGAIEARSSTDGGVNKVLISTQLTGSIYPADYYFEHSGTITVPQIGAYARSYFRL